MQSVSRLAKLGQLSVFLFAGLLLFALVLLALEAGSDASEALKYLRADFELGYPVEHAAGWQLFAGLICNFATDLVGLGTLFLAYGLIRGISSEGVFSILMARRLRWSDGLVLLIAPVSVFSHMIGGLVLSLSNPMGLRSVHFSIEETDISALILRGAYPDGGAYHRRSFLSGQRKCELRMISWS